MTLKNIPLDERPREKALKNGVEILSDSELIAIILHNGTKGTSVIELANQIIVEFGGLNHLLKADLKWLIKIKGINKAKAIELKVCYELANRLNLAIAKKQKKSIKSAIDIYQRYHLQIGNCKQEIFYALFLNVKLQVIQEEKLFIGGSDTSFIDLKILFKKALLCDAKKIICFHNHPSGESLPSEADLLLTQKMLKIGEFMNIKILDHLILGNGEYYSIVEKKQYFVSQASK